MLDHNYRYDFFSLRGPKSIAKLDRGGMRERRHGLGFGGPKIMKN